jgi:aminoglycoside phosphotransferase (APT) family kinase protein
VEDSLPTDSELRDGLERALAEIGRPAPSRVVRRPSEYRTSFPLEQLDVTLVDGEELRLAFKQLDWSQLDDEARLAKPDFLHDPAREPAVYASLLGRADVGAPAYCGALLEPEVGRHWLFVEWVEGRELYQVGELQLWGEAARWLARLHVAFGDQSDRPGSRLPLPDCLPLLDYNEAYYRRWLERACRFLAGDGERERSLEWLAERYDAVVAGLLSLPRTLLHGEFYASNVLVDGGSGICRVAAVDWELAARGPGLIDLAALVSGDWGEPDRDRIVAAYRSVVGADAFTSRQLDLARLHLAVQWLGWAPPRWVPPEGQRHDWLGEALELAERLEL